MSTMRESELAREELVHITHEIFPLVRWWAGQCKAGSIGSWYCRLC